MSEREWLDDDDETLIWARFFGEAVPKGCPALAQGERHPGALIQENLNPAHRIKEIGPKFQSRRG